MFVPILLTQFSRRERNSAVCCPTFADNMRESAENTENIIGSGIGHSIFLLHSDGGLRKMAAISAVPAVMVKLIGEAG